MMAPASTHKARRQFSTETKRRAVEEYLTLGTGAATVCERYGMFPGSLRYWVKAAGKAAPVRIRRSFSKAYKRAVAEELLTTGNSAYAVAKAHALPGKSARNWKRQYLAGKYGPPDPGLTVPKAYQASGAVEIRTPKGAVLVNAGADPAALRLAVQALQ